MEGINMDKVNYYLAFEKRPGDYKLIYINELDICNAIVSNDIASIDSFTLQYSEEEIKNSIRRSNTIPSDYMIGRLRIISDHKHNLDVMYKDIYSTLKKVQISDEELTRDFKNKLFGAYRKVVANTFNDVDFIKGLLNRFKIALNNGNKEEIFNIIEEIPYRRCREIYFMIYHELNENRQMSTLRNLKKNKDVA